MDVVCTNRIPEFFLITLMIPTGDVLDETRQHRTGQPDADFTISLSQSMNVCSLHVRISAGNSAGMSAPSEAVEVGKLYYPFKLLQSNIIFYDRNIVCSGSSTGTTTASSTAITSAGSRGNTQQGDSTRIIGEVCSIKKIDPLTLK